MSRVLNITSLCLLLTTALAVHTQQASLRIASLPGGAQMHLDGELKGATSPEGELLLKDLPAGEHKLRLSAPGYLDWVQSVALTPGGTTNVEAKLSSTAFMSGAAESPARQLFGPNPEYSKEALSAKLQGKVVLRLVVGTDGRPHDIRVERSLGLGLDEKAIAAVRQWTFEPALKNGQPVEALVNVEIAFCLSEEECPTSPLHLKFIENALKKGTTAKELATLVERNGVDFDLDQKVEKRLRAAGADDALILAIAKAKR